MITYYGGHIEKITIILLFSQFPQVHIQTNFGAVITIDNLILHVYVPH